MLALLDTDTDECILWPYGTDANGYAQLVTHDELSNYVHRRLCHLKHGAPPTPGHQAAHSCGNGHLGCVNWKHVRWATRKENEADKLAHGTRQAGAKHVHSRLSENDVLAIRASTATQTALARAYGVDQSQISLIRSGKRWASLTEG